MLALENVRVIDLTEALAGPYCTMILGDLGADVIKVERPFVGDQSRKWGPPFIGTESAYFLSVNRNKRSVALDIKSQEGRTEIQRLLLSADVFVCNVRRLESLKELGIDPDSVKKLNPRVIFCSITAYGRTGPYADRSGYDLVAQGEAGLMAATGEADGEPMRWPVAIADLSCGLWAANAILTALYVRERTGTGQFIDLSLLDSQLSWATVLAAQSLASEKRPERLGNRHANIVPYQVFKARDKYMIVAVGTQGHWHRFCAILKLGDSLCSHPKFATNADRLNHREELCEILNRKFSEQPAEHWLEQLRSVDIPCGPINSLDETLKDPQVVHRGMVVEIEHPMGSFKALGSPLHFSDTEISYRRRPPLLGEHTDEVLSEYEYHSGTNCTVPEISDDEPANDQPPCTPQVAIGFESPDSSRRCSRRHP
jgi:formyl-CoA transferase/CoA:oxalate CoA-transferase